MSCLVTLHDIDSIEEEFSEAKEEEDEPFTVEEEVSELEKKAEPYSVEEELSEVKEEEGEPFTVEEEASSLEEEVTESAEEAGLMNDTVESVETFEDQFIKLDDEDREQIKSRMFKSPESEISEEEKETDCTFAEYRLNVRCHTAKSQNIPFIVQ